MSQHSAVRFTHAIPCLSYTNAHTAIQWLVDAFGVEARQVYDGPDHTVCHAEVWFGEVCVMMGSLKESNMPPHKAGEYVVVASAAEVDGLHADCYFVARYRLRFARLWCARFRWQFLGIRNVRAGVRTRLGND